MTFTLDATVPPDGAVTRAICEVADDDTVRHTVEHHDVHREDDPARSEPWFRSDHGLLDADVAVSMNLWGFHPSIADTLAAAASAFARDHDEPKSELPLPTAVDAEIGAGRLRVDALAGGTTWIGITHRRDLPEARRRVAGLVGGEPRDR